MEMKRLGVVLILIFAFAGLADSIYLAQHESSGTPLICNIENLSGCNIVANSQYSRILGIPTADFGVLFYSILFVLAALELAIFDKLLRRVLQAFALIGLIISVITTAVQIFLINALCIYCLASAVITVIIFVIATLIEPIKKTVIQSIPTPSTQGPRASPKATQGTAQHLTMPPAP